MQLPFKKKITTCGCLCEWVKKEIEKKDSSVIDLPTTALCRRESIVSSFIISVTLSLRSSMNDSLLRTPGLCAVLRILCMPKTTALTRTGWQVVRRTSARCDCSSLLYRGLRGAALPFPCHLAQVWMGLQLFFYIFFLRKTEAVKTSDFLVVVVFFFKERFK